MRACFLLLAAALLTGVPTPSTGRPAIIGAAIEYRVESRDSLTALAGRFGVDVATLAAGIDWELAAEAVRLHEGVAVDVSKDGAPH